MSTVVAVIKNGDNCEQTFVFKRNEEMSEEKKIRSKLVQLFPASVGSLMCIPFGIMLGWPSPTYPKLLGLSSPLPITIDQSAMIAGFLMIGNILATPLSTWSFFGTKYGIIFGQLGMLMGWIIMWCATDIYFLLSSRIIIGLSFGYSVGQLKIYLKELCSSDLSPTLLKCINFYVFFGVILAYILGYFLSFPDLSMVVMAVTFVIFLACCFLPHSPKEYLRFGRFKEAETLIRCLNPNANVDDEIQKLHLEMIVKEVDLSFFQVLRDKLLRKKFVLIALLTFFQQFSGAPATIVYCQMILASSNLPYPKIYAIAYAIWYFISNFIGTFYLNRINRKICLLLSSIMVSAILALNVAVFYFDFNGSYWAYSSLVSMFLFIFCHTVGLGVVPFMLIPEYFPPEARNIMSKFQIIEFSALAIIITKIFQVLYDIHDLYVPFALFLCVSGTSIFFTLIFIPYESPVLDRFKDTKEMISL